LQSTLKAVGADIVGCKELHEFIESTTPLIPARTRAQPDGLSARAPARVSTIVGPRKSPAPTCSWRSAKRNQQQNVARIDIVNFIAHGI
jgi:hypothetical protein